MLSALVSKHPATYRDVLDQPEHMVAEIVAGTLYLSPLPPPRGALAKSGLGARLGVAQEKDAGQGGGWWVTVSPQLRLGNDVLAADLAAWPRASKRELLQRDVLDVAPVWVCEVVQPRTRALDLAVKRPAYARHGVAHLWLIDPDARTLEAFALDRGAWRLLATRVGDAEVALPPFDAISFALADLWA
jgi:hypothetical protein